MWPIRSCWRRSTASTSPRSRSRRPRRCSPARGPRTRSASTTCRAWRSNRSWRRGENAHARGKSSRRSAPTPTIPRYRRATRRPCVNSTRCTARRRRSTEGHDPMRFSALYGPLTSTGLAVALITGVLDQASKLWLLRVFHLDERGAVAIAPVVDLRLTWNAGISYGLLQQTGLGRWILLVVSVAPVILLCVWLARPASTPTALALGLIIGGAAGNAVDRLAYGAVADFVLVHITPTFDWYVFKLADGAIVAGVAGLLYESLLGHRAAKAP